MQLLDLINLGSSSITNNDDNNYGLKTGWYLSEAPDSLV